VGVPRRKAPQRTPCAAPTTRPLKGTGLRSLDRPAADLPQRGPTLTENNLHNGQIPIDQRTAFITALACLTTAVVLPPDQRQSLIDLLNLALQLYGRR
jgi:hypothetical protein